MSSGRCKDYDKNRHNSIMKEDYILFLHQLYSRNLDLNYEISTLFSNCILIGSLNLLIIFDASIGKCDEIFFFFSIVCFFSREYY